MTSPDDDIRAVVRRAACLLPSVTAVVHRCRTEADPGQDLARAAGALMSSFGALREALVFLPASPLVLRVDAMLFLEQRVVDEAAKLAFRPRTERWSRIAAAFGDGTTDAADELLTLAATL